MYYKIPLLKQFVIQSKANNGSVYNANQKRDFSEIIVPTFLFGVIM